MLVVFFLVGVTLGYETVVSFWNKDMVKHGYMSNMTREPITIRGFPCVSPVGPPPEVLENAPLKCNRATTWKTRLFFQVLLHNPPPMK